ncbi:MAG: glycosyltransferase family 2 protein [Chloroherpetonaceae bacterium]|nr:glycosyltransferase family 2 protein [Chloroherpetonaceae bacterium]
MNNDFFIILFAALFGLVFYTYLGYGLLLYVVVRVKRLAKYLYYQFSPRMNAPTSGNLMSDRLAYTPRMTMIIAAYNESSVIEEKLRNTFALRYPLSNLSVIVVTDGSTDETPKLVKRYAGATLLHQDRREGKSAALNRAMSFVTTSIVVFSDANSMLNDDALLELAQAYEDPGVGAVSGEKRIASSEKSGASSAGEGIYWKYESLLKKWDAELYSLVGAAGELFSIRTELFHPIPNDTLLDDFMISMQIAKCGYKIAYVPKAYALETASENIREEFKRKVRISTGGVQSILRLADFLNPFEAPKLWWQFISHRMLRWSLTPFALFLLFPMNLYLMLSEGLIFKALLILQCGFYLLGLLGYLFEKRKLRFKPFFIPFYFLVMNYAVVLGWFRYFRKSQSVLWERSAREVLLT